MTIDEHLRALAADPSDIGTRKVLSRQVRSRVGLEILWADFDERPDLASIADQILAESGSDLPSEIRARLLPVIRSIVDGVLDDDEQSGVTAVFKDWEANGRLDGNLLFDALLVPMSKRLRWSIAKFGNLRHEMSPGDLLSKFFLRLQQSGLPDTLENRKAFYAYSEKILRHLLVDLARQRRRKKRDIGVNVPLEDVLELLEKVSTTGSPIAAKPELYIALAEAVDGLPDKIREVIRYRFLLGCSYNEITETLEISRAKANRLKDMGLVMLKEVLTSRTTSQS